MSDINYATGRFGVVDIFHRNIWINYEDESIAHAIRKTFSSKAGLIIYDLSIFDNFVEDPPLIGCSYQPGYLQHKNGYLQFQAVSFQQ